MGLRGPKPKPQEELKRRNSWRGKIFKASPRTIYGRPFAPRGLDKIATKLWRKLLPELEAAGVLQPIHGHVLARYCMLRSIAYRLEDFVKAAGTCAIETYDLPDGKKGVKSVTEYPQMRQLIAICAELRRIEDSFGMTPSSRTRISLPTNATKNKDTQREKDNARFFGRKEA